jgi:hypothetical protein
VEEVIKNRIILVLFILSVILFIGAVSSCRNVRQYRLIQQEEIAKRLDAEEKLSKSVLEKSNLETKLNNLAKELEEEKAVHEFTKKALVQEQLNNQSLKEELEKLTKLKEALEEDLKEVLVSRKSTKKKE